MGTRKIIFMLLAACAVSCTVFEDRRDCPCWLSFILDGCKVVTDTVHVHTWNGATITSDVLCLDDADVPHEVEVPRGEVITCAFTDIHAYNSDGYVITVPQGTMPQPVFVHASRLMCDGEFACDSVRLHKQWVNITVALHRDGVPVRSGGEDMPDGGDEYSFVVHSDVTGLDMLSLEPVYGELEFVPERGEAGQVMFNVLRHDGGTDSLELDIMRDGVLVDRMNLGEHLDSVGYDWEDASLADVDIKVNIITGNVSIIVVPWNDLGHEDIEI